MVDHVHEAAVKVKSQDVEAISAEDYMAEYAHDFYEWVDGKVFAMPPVTERHYELVIYTNILLAEYLSLNPIGKVRGAPFVIAVEVTNSRREPDLQVILNSNPGQLTETRMVGPADICIEVVSAESTQRDYGEKLAEYEKGGVREYWIVDPIRNITHFYRLGEDENYHLEYPNKDGNYQTPLLPRFVLHVPTFWVEKLPSPGKIAQSVADMLKA